MDDVEIRRYNLICVSNLAVTCVASREFLCNIQVRLHVGDKHLLPPVGDEVLLPSNQLGHIIKNIQLGMTGNSMIMSVWSAKPITRSVVGMLLGVEVFLISMAISIS